MSKLRKQINKTVSDIHRDNNIIKRQQNVLLKIIGRGRFMVFGLITSFVMGYLFARKKTLTQLMRAAIFIPLKFKRMYSSVKFLFL